MEDSFLRSTFGHLLDERRWCAWKSLTKEGKVTKMPVVSNGPARSNDCNTWMSFTDARTLTSERGLGLGVFLGPSLCDPTLFLIGFDLDTCLKPEGNSLTPWAQAVVAACPEAYWEVSPSGTGLKGFARAKKEDLEAFSAHLTQKLSKTWKQSGATEDHPPCIDLYAQGRYFTITGDTWPDSAQQVGFLNKSSLGEVITQLGPKLSGKHNDLKTRGKRKKTDVSVRTAKVESERTPNDVEGAAALAKLTSWWASANWQPFRRAQMFFETGYCDAFRDHSRSGQEFQFAYYARLACLEVEEFEAAIAYWTDLGFAHGADDGDQREEHQRHRDWSRCWHRNEGARHPLYVADKEANELLILVEDGRSIRYDQLSSFIEPVYELVDELGEYWRHFAIRTRIGINKGVSIPNRAWAGRRDDFLEMLAREGLYVAANRGTTNELRAWINSGRPPQATLVQRTGWLGDGSFVLPDRIVKADVHAHYVQKLNNADDFCSSGELADWQTQVAQPCAGNSRLVVSMCAAFLGPLLKPIGLENGGLHFRGPSSIGKSTALSTSASVWGAPEFVGSWRATDNGLEGAAECRSDTFLLLDELSEANAAQVDKIAYMLANGRGKDRANRDGSIKKAKTWRIVFLSSGEISLADKLYEKGKGITAGQAVRVLDVSADAGEGLGLFEELHGAASPAGFAEQQKAAASKFFGSAGPAFVEQLVVRQSTAYERFNAHHSRFLEQNSFEIEDGQERRALARFAALAAAGELAVEFGILPWAKYEAVSGVLRCFGDWLSGRGHRGPFEQAKQVEVVRSFLATHGQSHFQRLERDGSVPRALIERAGFLSGDRGQSATYHVLPDYFKKLCAQNGVDPTATAKTLIHLGYLEPGDGNHLSRRIDLSSVGLSRNSRAYAISSRIFDIGQ